MRSQYVVVIDDIDNIGPVEDAIVQLAVQQDVTFHVISTGEGDVLVTDKETPGHVRLMFLVAKLADRLIRVTGELASAADLKGLEERIGRLQPERVYVATPSGKLDRMLHRDMASRLRGLLDDVEVIPLPVAA
ncbi:MAG: hypothetical protein ABGZ36_09965 [Actinomycetota bacterium]